MTPTLDELRRPGRRILLTGAAVVTMDPELGVLPRADLLIEGDRIAAVGVDLPAGDTLVIDVTGAVLAPGFVDTTATPGRRNCAASCRTSTTSASTSPPPWPASPPPTSRGTCTSAPAWPR
ncbi:amidohydrolase family protein [Streptosporangium soli]|nr:hypothetical protein [Streptosporangium sp. KLBMP 9127]